LVVIVTKHNINKRHIYNLDLIFTDFWLLQFFIVSFIHKF